MSWTSSGDDGALGDLTGQYVIQYSTVATTAWNRTVEPAYARTITVGALDVAPGTARTTTLTGLTEGATYFVVLWTGDDVPVYSEISNRASAAATSVAPAAVTDLGGEGGDAAGTVTLQWSSPGDDGPTGNLTGTYVIQYSSVAGTVWNRTVDPANAKTVTVRALDVAPGTRQTTTLTGMKEGASYEVVLWSGDESSTYSELSAPASITATAIPPGPVTDLAVDPGPSVGSLKLSWTSPGNNGDVGKLTGKYVIQGSISGTTAWDRETTPLNGFRKEYDVSNVNPKTPQTVTVPDLEAGAVYYVVMWTGDESGTYSNRSNKESARTPSGGPTITGVSPSSGLSIGGGGVTITGTNLQAGAVVRFGTTAGTGVAVSDDGLRLTVTAPAHERGTVDITVLNPDETTATRTGGYTYTAVPSVTGVAPARGVTTGGARVTIRGTGFQAGARVSFGGTGGTDVAFVNDGELTATTPALLAGAVTVKVTNPDGGEGFLVDGYTVVASPVMGGIFPSAGSPAGGTLVTITGANFQAGATVRFGDETVPGEVTETGRLTARTPSHAAGSVGVTLTNPDGGTVTVANGFNYNGSTALTIGSVSPPVGSVDGGTVATIRGTGFQYGIQVSFGGVPSPLASYVSDEEVTVLAPAHAAGTVGVIVTNPSAERAVLSEGFRYASERLAVSGVSPGSGPAGGGTAVTITGRNFQAGAVVVFDQAPGTGVSVSADGTRITAVAPAHGAGSVNVSIQNPDGSIAMKLAGYAYEGTNIVTPLISGVSPRTGLVEGGTAVTVTGKNFEAGAVVVFDHTPGTGVSVSGDGTRITAVAPAHGAGSVNVSIQNPDGSIAVKLAGYAYEGTNVVPPVISGITPGTGVTTSGGARVTIRGSGFKPGARVTFGGTAATSVTFVSESELTAIAPPLLAGGVTVSVANPDGGEGRLSNGLTVVAIPVIAGVSPSSGLLAGGTLVTITGANFQPGATVSFDGVGVLAEVTEYGRLTVRTPAHGEGAVAVTLTNPNGGTVTVANGFTYSATVPGDTPATSLAEVKVLSSLFRPGQGEPLTFERMPTGTRARLYSMRGTFLGEFYEEGGRVTWDGRDFDGRNQPSGGYLAILEHRGAQRRIRFAIQR